MEASAHADLCGPKLQQENCQGRQDWVGGLRRLLSKPCEEGPCLISHSSEACTPLASKVRIDPLSPKCTACLGPVSALRICLNKPTSPPSRSVLSSPGFRKRGCRDAKTCQTKGQVIGIMLMGLLRPRPQPPRPESGSSTSRKIRVPLSRFQQDGPSALPSIDCTTGDLSLCKLRQNTKCDCAELELRMPRSALAAASGVPGAVCVGSIVCGPLG